MSQEEQTKIDKLINHVDDYLETQKKLVLLIAADKTSQATAAITSSIIIIFLFLIAFVFASISLAYLLSVYFGSTAVGFIAVSIFYLVAAIVIYLSRKKILHTPIINNMIKNFLKNEDNE